MLIMLGKMEERDSVTPRDIFNSVTPGSACDSFPASIDAGTVTQPDDSAPGLNENETRRAAARRCEEP